MTHEDTGPRRLPATLRGLFAFAAALHRGSRALCIAALVLLVALELVIVLLRYGFGTGFLALSDLASYSFAVVVLLGLPVALVEDRHVRVDVLREHQSRAMRRASDVLALLVFLIPAFVLIAWYAMPDVLYSWRIREGSVETGGLGGLYLVKTLLPVVCVLMLLQGVVQGIASFVRRD